MGDVSLHVQGLETHRRVIGHPLVDECALAQGDVVMLFTNGISTRADLEGELDLLREHPIVIAHQIVHRFARDDDDALVLVVA